MQRGRFPGDLYGCTVEHMIGQKLIDLELTQQLLDHLGVVVVQNESVTEAAESRRGFTFGVNVALRG